MSPSKGGGRARRPTGSGGGKAGGTGKGRGAGTGGSRAGKAGSTARNTGGRGAPAAGRKGHGRPEAGTLVDAGAQMFQVGVEHGTDLAHFLQMSVPGKLSVRKIRRFLEEGRCRVNGRIETFGSRKVYRRDIVSFVAPTREEQRQRFAFERKRVLYDEHDLVAYDKPPGLPVTPTDAGTGPSLVGILRRDLGDLEACHRLDADTSGVVLLARTPAVRERYEAAFRDHEVAKRYLALVRGRPPGGGTQRSGLILVEQGPGYERWASGKGQGALLAITRWRLLAPVGRDAALVVVEPRTGRTHQIRVHLAELGHPLLGDRVYGDRKDPIHVARHLLHAEHLTAPHPSGTGELSVEAPRPKDFDAAIAQLDGR